MKMRGGRDPYWWERTLIEADVLLRFFGRCLVSGMFIVLGFALGLFVLTGTVAVAWLVLRLLEERVRSGLR